MSELPVPPFYAPANAAAWGYRPDQQAVLDSSWMCAAAVP